MWAPEYCRDVFFLRSLYCVILLRCLDCVILLRSLALSSSAKQHDSFTSHAAESKDLCTSRTLNEPVREF